MARISIQTIAELKNQTFSKLENVYNFQYGQFNINPDNGGAYPIYGANGIIGGYTEFNAEKSVIIGHMGENAGSVLWEEGKHFVTYNGTIAKPKNENELNAKFGYYWLVNLNIRKICAGSGQPFLSYNDLNELPITFPPLPEQKKIASVLSALDNKIALNKKMNQKPERMAKRLYDYGFVQYDFPDKNGHPYKTTGGKMEYNPTLKREIPVGWEVRTLGEYLDCNKYSLTAKSYYDFIQYLDTSSLTENTLESLQRYESIAESPSRAKRIVHANDILYSTVRPQQKHYGIIKNPVQNMIASTGFAILSYKYGSEYNDMFYLFLIQEKNLIKLSAIADSNASSYPSFNPSDLLNLSICLPEDIKTIEPLVKKFSSLFGIIERNQKENQKLTALRDKLLPLLMNGQVVVG
ncbi:MAG: restriction endonuclease subunit S [Fibrobacteraceae bacterium]|nr:restriction endonuclease subunit S [Fibrobacteraceae bacterium]